MVGAQDQVRVQLGVWLDRLWSEIESDGDENESKKQKASSRVSDVFGWIRRLPLMMIGLLDFIGIARLSKGRGVAYVHSLIGCIEKERKERGGGGSKPYIALEVGRG